MKKDEEKMIEKAQVKKTVESMVKETFFSEYEALKTENEALKTQLAQMEEPKAIVHNPEPTEKVKVEAPKSTRDLVMKFINQ
jgi:regulator of replication initiation timing